MNPVVFVVDDDISVRESLARLIACAGWQSQTFASAHDFLTQAPAHESGPGCLVLDLELPDLNGLELQERITATARRLPVIFISGYADVPKTVRAMKAGASEFLTKPLQTDVLVEAIQRALEQSRVEQAEHAELSELRNRHTTLTPREREVMLWVVAGLLNKQVAVELGMQEFTVKAHRGRVMQKMKASSLAQLVRMASRLGLELPTPPHS